MKFSIIIPTFNKFELTKRCLESIFSKTEEPFEVIVVDNASTDETQEYLAKETRVKAILNKNNLGFSRANNLAARKATGEILVFLNNDTEVHRGWLKAIEETLLTENKVGAIGVKLIFPNGRIQHAGIVISEDHLPRNLYSGKKDFEGVNKQREFQAVTAACIAIPKKVFQKVGGFDEGYINGLEDADICHRIRQEGFRIIYQPRSVVTHYEGATSGRFKFLTENQSLYIKRWIGINADEHHFLMEDGYTWFQVYMNDLKSMAYERNRYVPNWIKIARLIYIPAQKTTVIVQLLFSLNFRTLLRKIRKVLNA